MKNFASVAEAEAAKMKAISEKTKKGYTESPNSKVISSKKPSSKSPKTKKAMTGSGKSNNHNISPELIKAAGLTSGESLLDFETASQVVKVILTALQLKDCFSVTYFELQDVDEYDYFIYENLSIGYFLEEDFVDLTGAFADVAKFHEFMLSLLSSNFEFNSVSVDRDEYLESYRKSTQIPAEIDWEFPPTIFQYDFYSRIKDFHFISDAKWTKEAQKQAINIKVKDNFHKDLLKLILWGIDQLQKLHECNHEFDDSLSCMKCNGSFSDFDLYKSIFLTPDPDLILSEHSPPVFDPHIGEPENRIQRDSEVDPMIKFALIPEKILFEKNFSLDNTSVAKAMSEDYGRWVAAFRPFAHLYGGHEKDNWPKEIDDDFVWTETYLDELDIAYLSKGFTPKTNLGYWICETPWNKESPDYILSSITRTCVLCEGTGGKGSLCDTCNGYKYENFSMNAPVEHDFGLLKELAELVRARKDSGSIEAPNFCSKCGKKFLNEDLFCSSCGLKR